jgi:16S rRNA (guanine1516-N2)-methyltransferase
MASAAPGSDARGFSFVLEEQDGRLSLRAQHHPDYGVICADWTSAAARSRVRSGKRQALARATGVGGRTPLRVIDATAGLGRDAFTLAALGAEVLLIERHAQIAALLRDALRRAHADAWSADAAARMSIVEADALALLRARTVHADVIYLDPMYPHSAKSALPQKEMQLFRELTGGDADADQLLDPALACAAARVVVKRPLRASPLAGRAPHHEIATGQARFDVYPKHAAGG